MEDQGAAVVGVIVAVLVSLLVQWVLIQSAVFHGLMRFLDTMGGRGKKRHVRQARESIDEIAAEVMQYMEANNAKSGVTGHGAGTHRTSVQ
jgi:mannitol-specific phosphotransferase system IIBC component